MRRPRGLGTGLVLAALLAAAPATADDKLKDRLRAVERDLDRSQEERAALDRRAVDTDRELRDLKQRTVAVARDLHDRDREVQRLENRLADLTRREATAADGFETRRAQLAATLAALQRIARLPAATLIAIPQPPDATIRSAILLRAAVPELRNEAAALRREIAILADLRTEIAEDRRALDAAHRALTEEREKLAALTVEKQAALNATRSEERAAAERIASLSRKAGSLRELLGQIDRRRKDQRLRAPDFEPPPESAASVTPDGAAAGDGRTYDLPAPGRIVTAYGDRLPSGIVNKGLWIETRPASAVVAPLAGRVVFAGRFRGYGNLVILEARDKRHALLSGMATISAQVGDEVLAGEPVGEMNPSTKDTPRLYFEIRRRGQPVNPLPSLTANRNKVNG